MNKLLSIFITILLCGYLSTTSFSTESINQFNAAFIENDISERLLDKYTFLKQEHINITIKNKELFNTYPKNAAFFNIEYPVEGTLLGRRLFSIIYFNEKLDALDIVKLAVDTEAKALAYYTTRKIKSRSTLTKDDLKQKLTPISTYTTPFTLSEEYILSQQSIRNISANTLLSDKWLEPIPAIQQGDYVTAIISKQGFQLEVPAQALDKGMIGELIRIKTQLSSKIVKGEISHEKSVIVSSI